jgi:hypothetical protein
MIWRVALAVFLTACISWLALGERPVKAQFNGCPAGFCSPIKSGNTYTGPLDVVPGAIGYWGLRCSKSSYTGNVADVWDGLTGSTTETLITCSSGGTLNTNSPTAIATTCAVSCCLKTVYDQTGNGQNATNGNTYPNQCALYSAGVFGTKAGMNGNNTNGNLIATLNSTIAQQWVISVVYNGANGTNQCLAGAPGGTSGTAQTDLSAANQAAMYAGSNVTATASDSSGHAVQFIANGALSNIDVDSTSNVLNAGTNSMATNWGLTGCYGYLGFSGNEGEVILYGSGTTWGGTQSAAMHSNQSTYYGTP